VVVALGYGSSPKFVVSFNISVMAESSDFIFGTEFGLAKSTYEIAPKDKSGHWAWPSSWELPNI